MIRSILLLAGSFAFTYFLFKVLFKDLKVSMTTSETAAYGTVIDYYCSRLGVEYFVTNRGALVLHVDPHGKPVICHTFQPLAGE